ncbi:YbaB/EbfC family nucleoid-associated protein [Streptomyces sp. NPDC088387]|uniref:YbaB/EbfC family nucleoid-associated protein n=1 Tax=Streptomyces sp. NPDC088387 TaxID=3365859 RepID=UPI0038203D06
MNDELRQQLDQAMADFETQRLALLKAREEIAAMTTTARSKDRVVEITLGADGQPNGLRFLDNKHQTMSGKDLANSVLQAMSRAHQQLMTQVHARFGELAATGIGVAADGPDAVDRLEGLGLEELLEPLRAPDGPLNMDRGRGRA